jgi:hypothetical protein
MKRARPSRHAAAADPRVTVHSDPALPARIEDAMRAELGDELGRHGALVERATVRLHPVERHVECEIKVMLGGLQSVAVSQRASSPALAFRRALPRISRAVGVDLDRRGLGGGRRARRAAEGVEPSPDEPNLALIGRGVGRGGVGLARALDRPEKRRGDALVDTSLPGVSASDRKAGGGHSARRNTRGRRAGMTATLEDSVQRPSRKSTRRSANRGKPSQGKERTAVARTVQPSARGAGDRARRGRR